MNNPLLSFRVTWSHDKHYFTFHVHAEDFIGALKKARKHIERVGLSYYSIETITQDNNDIPF